MTYSMLNTNLILKDNAVKPSITCSRCFSMNVLDFHSQFLQAYAEEYIKILNIKTFKWKIKCTIKIYHKLYKKLTWFFRPIATVYSQMTAILLAGWQVTIETLGLSLAVISSLVLSSILLLQNLLLWAFTVIKTKNLHCTIFSWQMEVWRRAFGSMSEFCSPWLAWPPTSCNMAGFARVFFRFLNFFKAETLKLKILRRNRKRNLMQTNTTDLYTALISYISIVPFIMKKPNKIYKLPSKGSILCSTPQCAHHWKRAFRVENDP